MQSRLRAIAAAVSLSVLVCRTHVCNITLCAKSKKIDLSALSGACSYGTSMQQILSNSDT
jgi:hypothetical protein